MCSRRVNGTATPRPCAASVQQESTATLGGNRWTSADPGGQTPNVHSRVFKPRFDVTSILQAEGQGFESPKLHLQNPLLARTVDPARVALDQPVIYGRIAVRRS
jgi:hypothetical protein